jgi:hypothetical protein
METRVEREGAPPHLASRTAGTTSFFSTLPGALSSFSLLFIQLCTGRDGGGGGGGARSSSVTRSAFFSPLCRFLTCPMDAPQFTS